MLLQLLPVLAPVFIATAIGFAWARSGAAYPSEFIGRLVMTIGTPCLVVSVVARTGIDFALMGQIMLAAALTMTLMGLIALVLVRLLRLDLATYLPPLLFPNNGNMGLPVCLFAFGQTGLALALGVFMVMMFATFTLGIVIAAGAGKGTDIWRTLIRQPVLWAMLVAMLLLISGAALPLWLDNTLSLLGDFAIPLMMITLGVSLGRLKVRRWRLSLVMSLLRVVGGGLLGWLVAELLALDGTARGVLIVQAAMPVAVFNYILALRYERDHQEVAAMVVTSTILAFIVLPLLLSQVMA